MNDEQDGDPAPHGDEHNGDNPEVQHSSVGGDRRPTWIAILLPSLLVLFLFFLALLWNWGAGLVVLIVGAAVIISWVIQRRGPHEPGE